MGLEEMMMKLTLQMLGVHPVRHKPNQALAVELTASNIDGVAEWINENVDKDSDRAVVQYDDETPLLWIGGRLATLGMVVIRGTVGEFYAIEKQVYLNSYEDVPQKG